MKKILFIIFILFLVSGCTTKEIIYQNQTYYNETRIETICSPCVCNPVTCEISTCKETMCDNTALQKCRLENARIIADINYYKELSTDYLLNDTIETLQINLTKCIVERDNLNKTVEEIKKNLN